MLLSPAKRAAVVWCLLYVPREISEHLSFALRVRDVSRFDRNQSAIFPILRENELATRAPTLLDVPVGSRYRTKLRLYSVSDLHEDGFTVIMRDAEGKFAASRFVSPTRASPFEPLYGELNLQSVLDDEGSPDHVHVDFNGGTGGWALVTVTDNITQQVTVVTPE